jgi:NTP pyrophosphatase (non-canonical NTP hydrolase)
MTSPRQQEILTIAQEECAEVIQVISKIFRFGLGHEHISSHRGITNTEKLNEEVGDLLAMIDLLIDEGILDTAQLTDAKQRKIDKLRIWSDIYKVNQIKE